MVPLNEQQVMQSDHDDDDAIKTPPQKEEKKMIKKIKFVNGKKTIIMVDPDEEEKSEPTSPNQNEKSGKDTKRRLSTSSSLELPANFTDLMKSPSRARRYSSVLKSPRRLSLQLDSCDDEPSTGASGEDDYSAFKTPKQSRKAPVATFSNSSSISTSLSGDESYVVYEDEQYFTPSTDLPGSKSPHSHKKKHKKQQSKNDGQLDTFLSPSKKKKSPKSSKGSVVSAEESYYDDGEEPLILSHSPGKRKEKKSRRPSKSGSSMSSSNFSTDLTTDEENGADVLSPSGKKKRSKKRTSKSSISSDDTFFSLPLTDEDNDERMIMDGSLIVTPSRKKDKAKRRSSKVSISSMSSNDFSLLLAAEEWEEDLVDEDGLKGNADDAEFLSPSGKKKKKKSSKKKHLNDDPKTPTSTTKRRTSISSSDMSISLGDDNDNDISLVVTPERKKKKKMKSPNKKSPKDKVSKPRKSLSEQLENLNRLEMDNDDEEGGGYSPRRNDLSMRKRSSYNFQDLISPPGRSKTLSMRSSRSSDDFLSPRHTKFRRRGSLISAAPSDDSISIDASFFAQEEKLFTRKLKKSKKKKSFDGTEDDDVTSATIRAQKKRIKEIKARLAEIKESTEDDIDAMKQDYSNKKKELKRITKEAYSKARKDEAQKFQEIRASGQHMIDYMQRENQNLLNEAIELKEGMSVIKKQTKVLEKKKEKLDKDMKSLSAYVVSKMQSKEKKEKAAYNCQLRYIPNYESELATSMKYLEAEQRVKKKFQAMIKKVAKAVKKNGSDPTLTKEILAMISEGEQEAENVGDRVAEDMDFLVQEFECQ